MDFNIGKGSWWEFALAYAFGILVFLFLLGSLAVGIYWIFMAVKEKAEQQSAAKRAITITSSIAALLILVLLGWLSSQPIG